MNVRICTTLLAVTVGLLHRARAEPGPGHPPGPAHFQALIDKEGANGIVSRLYVAPPDLMRPLLDGIALGNRAWLDVYARLRAGVTAADQSGVTEGYLDAAAARALGNAPTEVLSLLRDHPEIPVQRVCGNVSEDDSDVLRPRELLEALRRERVIANVADRNLTAVRSRCTESAHAMARRQLRIFLASFGADDSSARSIATLSATDQRALASVLAAARADPSLQARRDGNFPDGLFRLRELPYEVSKHCADYGGRIANPEGPWESTHGEDRGLPQARLLNACQLRADVWELTCQRGGFSHEFHHVRVQRINTGWVPVFNERVDLAPRLRGRPDYWPECAPTGAVARVPLPLTSPWLAFKGVPPARGAIGVLALDPGAKTRLRVRWADGSVANEVETQFLPTPEATMLPTLGSLTWPAVFDVRENHALVSGPKGWAWTPVRGEAGGEVIDFDTRLEDATRRLRVEIGDVERIWRGYSLHEPNLIVVDPQPARRQPNDHAPISAHVDARSIAQCGSSSELRGRAAPPRTRVGRPAPSPIRIVERRGDWARVIAPNRAVPWYACLDRAAIAWNDRPAGWVRLAKDGPVPGTKVRLWSIRAWGAWP